MSDIDFTNTFTDQEGVVWDMDYAKCPRCEAKSKLKYRSGAGGYFGCPQCGVAYDEPNFDPPEDAFITVLDDEEELKEGYKV